MLVFLFFLKKKVCRVFFGHSATSLPSARQKTLDKLVFADTGFAECCLPSVILDKPFAECFLGFAECLWHTTMRLFPVVKDKELL